MMACTPCSRVFTQNFSILWYTSRHCLISSSEIDYGMPLWLVCLRDLHYFSIVDHTRGHLETDFGMLNIIITLLGTGMFSTWHHKTFIIITAVSYCSCRNGVKIAVVSFVFTSMLCARLSVCICCQVRDNFYSVMLWRGGPNLTSLWR